MVQILADKSKPINQINIGGNKNGILSVTLPKKAADKLKISNEIRVA